MTTQRERRAADARRAAAELAGEKRGEAGYRQFRHAPPAGDPSRTVAMPSNIRVAREKQTPGGKALFHTWGYFTTYERGYPMWDDFGRYEEMTMRGSGAATMARKPDLGFLVNHKGVTMARTKTGTLLLKEDDTGGWHDGWLNPERTDVSDLVKAIEDGHIDEMSFAFMIPDGGGVWTDDFTTFQIRAYDLEGGDVSAVNNGANPHTSIAGSAGEVLRSLARLPRGARDEAARMLSVDDVERQERARERIVVSAPGVDRGASDHVRMLQWRKANTARRYAQLAEDTGLGVPDLMNVRLPWYEVREAVAGEPAAQDDSAAAPDTTDVLIYDEIGGSFGVTADEFAADLAAIDTPNIRLRINSPGGSVIDAVAIASSIRHKRDDGAHVTAYVDGIAASAATVIAIAADEVVGMPGSQWMVHKASTTIDGNDDAADKMATFLRFQSRNIADQYAAKAGGTSDDWYQMMDAETWFTTEDAQNAGLVDRAWNSGNARRGERAATDPRLTRRWDDLPYRYVSRADAPVTQRRRPGVTPAARPEETRDAQAGTEGSTPVKPAGRSIALIEAQMIADGMKVD